MSTPKTYIEFERLILAHNYTSPAEAVILAKCRELFNLTQQELADKVGVQRATISNIESGRIKKRLRKSTQDKILNAFQDLYASGEEVLNPEATELPLPFKRQMDELGKHLFKQPTDEEAVWHVCYLTRRPHNNHLVRASITISRKGQCTLRHTENDLVYRGTVYFESARRLLFIFDSKTERIKERMVFRFDCPLNEPGKALTGSWLGIDGNEQQTHSRVILYPDASPKDDDAIRRELNNLPSIFITDSASGAPKEEASILNTWHRYWIMDEIINSNPGDTLDFCSTYFHEMKSISLALKTLHHKLKDTSNSAKVKLNIMMLTPELDQVLKTRFKLMPYIENPREAIINQAQHCLNIANNLKAHIDIKVRFYDVFPMGHVFKFSDRTLYLGRFLPADLASDSPMTVIRACYSPMWQQYESNLDCIHENSIDASDYLEKLEKQKQPKADDQESAP